MVWLVQLVCERVVCAAQRGAPAPPERSYILMLAARLSSEQNAIAKYSANLEHVLTGPKWSFQMCTYKVALWAETEFSLHKRLFVQGTHLALLVLSPVDSVGVCTTITRERDWILIFTVPPPVRHTHLFGSPKPCVKLSCVSWRREKGRENVILKV